MKLKKELEPLVNRLNQLNKKEVIDYIEQERNKEIYRDFELGISHSLMRLVTSSQEISTWYDKYNCHDIHIDTLAKKACKILKFI